MTFRVAAGSRNQNNRVHVETKQTGRTAGGNRVYVKHRNNDSNFISDLINLISVIFCCIFCCKMRNDESERSYSLARGGGDRGRREVPSSSRQNHPGREIPNPFRQNHRDDRRGDIYIPACNPQGAVPGNHNGRGNVQSANAAPVIRQVAGQDRNRKN